MADSLGCMCYGAEDEYRNPCCDGDDVQGVQAKTPDGHGVMLTFWCRDCRNAALAAGYTVLVIDPAFAVELIPTGDPEDDRCPECGAEDPFNPARVGCASCAGAVEQIVSRAERAAGWDPSP